jgi:hypothetical protein
MAGNTTPAEREQLARIAAFARWAREDPHLTATRGQAGLVAKFEREAREADPSITDAEAARRGMCAYREHMIRLSLKGRAARKAAKKAGT